MQPNGAILLQRSSGRLCPPVPSLDFSSPIEQALFRARTAFDAGWQLTPIEIVALVGPEAWRADRESTGTHETVPESEDEIDDIPLFFGER